MAKTPSGERPRKKSVRKERRNHGKYRKGGRKGERTNIGEPGKNNPHVKKKI